MKLRLLAATALAAIASLASPREAAAATHHHAAAHHEAPSYPMKADAFRLLMEERIDHVRATIDKKLDRRGVSPERKKAIHKIFDEASKDARAEIDRAAADGTVTQREAEKVKTLTLGLRAKVRERLRAEKNPQAAEKLAKEDAAKKEKAAAKEDAAKKEKAAAIATKAAPAKNGDHAPAPKTKATKTAKASPAKKAAGPTKPAKTSPGKKRKRAQAKPGASL